MDAQAEPPALAIVAVLVSMGDDAGRKAAGQEAGQLGVGDELVGL